MNEQIDNDLKLSLSQALDFIKTREGDNFSNAKVNLAELQRLTNISRAKLRRLKQNGFADKPNGNKGKTSQTKVLSGYEAVLNNFLKTNLTNSQVCYERLQEVGYEGGLTTVKMYIQKHKHLIPAKRQIISPQGNRGRRYSTEPGQSYQMDWGFVDVLAENGEINRAACFAMICHHCGQRFIEFFPNAKQENLFIGMIHAFKYMGIPKTVLTDNMKSVVNKRDSEGKPIWNHDYEVFMKVVGFETRLCKPYHPFTKGKVERLVQFVKGNFLAGRTFMNMTDLNEQALDWCNRQNSRYQKAVNLIPNDVHAEKCGQVAVELKKREELFVYLCPERRISFDGFVNYEGRRFGVPYTYTQKTVHVYRHGRELMIYSEDMKHKLVTHEVTWSRSDSYCKDQYARSDQPEEFPTADVKTLIEQITQMHEDDYFDQFDFSGGDDE